jgi:hypothetical protein
MTFETFLNLCKKRKNVSKNKRITAILADTAVKTALTSSTQEDLEKMCKELGLKYKKEACHVYKERFTTAESKNRYIQKCRPQR